jgi:hypothetical protein
MVFYVRKNVQFLFWGSASCCAYFIKVIGGIVPRNNYLRCLFIFIFPLHVSADDGSICQNIHKIRPITQNNGSVVSEVTSRK